MFKPDMILYDYNWKTYIRLSYYLEEEDWWRYVVWKKNKWQPGLHNRSTAFLEETTRTVGKLEALVVLGERI